MTLPMPLSALPSIDGAKLPAVYERATQALAECTRIDECQSWANKAEALASYARQSKDESLRKMADRIQARAIRRCGELLKQIEPDKGGYHGNYAHDGTDRSMTRTEAATQAGLSERQKVTALRVATIPEPVFEAAVAQEEPPTVTQLAEQGKQTKPVIAAVAPVTPQPLHDLGGIDPYLYARATELQGALKRLQTFCQKHEPKALAGAFKPHEIPALKTALSEVEAWLDRFIVNL
jgi:hypothetical protein